MSISTLKRKVAIINNSVDRIENKEHKLNPLFLPFLSIIINYRTFSIENQDGTIEKIERLSYKLGYFGDPKEVNREDLFDKVFKAMEKKQHIQVMVAPPRRKYLTQLRIKYAKEPLIIEFEDKNKRTLQIPYNPNESFGGNVPKSETVTEY